MPNRPFPKVIMNKCIFRQAWIEITIINREEIYFSIAITEFSGDYHKSVLLSDSFRLEVMIHTQSFVFSVTTSPQTISMAHFLLLPFSLSFFHFFSITFLLFLCQQAVTVPAVFPSDLCIMSPPACVGFTTGVHA